MSLGGVGRNIAEVSTRLGRPVRLVSAVASDEAGRQMISSCKELGIDVKGVAQLGSSRTATYTALLDGSGELVGAVADMAIFESIGPDVIRQGCRDLAKVALVVCDGNLGPKALEEALRKARTESIPAWFEPVSVAKSVRGRQPLPWHLISPNWDELLAILGLPANPIRSEAPGVLPDVVSKCLVQALEASTPLAENIFLSLGPLGCVLASRVAEASVSSSSSTVRACRSLCIDVASFVRTSSVSVPALEVEVKVLQTSTRRFRLLWYRLLKPLESVVDVTGAGDALLAGTASAFSAGWFLEEAVFAGLLAAHLTLFAEGAVAPTLNPKILEDLRTSITGERTSRL